jgi:hypothetical protein
MSLLGDGDGLGDVSGRGSVTWDVDGDGLSDGRRAVVRNWADRNRGLGALRIDRDIRRRLGVLRDSGCLASLSVAAVYGRSESLRDV